MACGEFGPGRMAEPAAIVEAIEARARQARRFAPKSAAGCWPDAT